MNRLTVLAATAGLLTACSGDPSQSGLVYYPMFIGSSWKYEMSGHKQLIGKIIETKAIRKEKVGFTDCTVLEAYLDGQRVATEHLSASKKGIFRHSLNEERISTPVCLMKFPYKRGAKWEETYNTREYGKVKFVVDSTDEDVTVPYGKVHALRSDLRAYKGSQEVLSTTYWFAKGMGMVKQTVNMNGINVSIDLQSYNLGLPN
jgi:hypothetical protein